MKNPQQNDRNYSSHSKQNTDANATFKTTKHSNLACYLQVLLHPPADEPWGFQSCLLALKLYPGYKLFKCELRELNKITCAHKLWNALKLFLKLYVESKLFKCEL